MASDARPQQLILADSCWHSTRNLFQTWPPDSAPTARLLQIEAIDWQNARNRNIPFWKWGARTKQITSQKSLLTAELFPGWMKKWPQTGQWPLARAARRWLNAGNATPENTALWITYPFYLTLAQQLQPGHLLYYNLDDYRCYWPGQSSLVETAEAKAIEQAKWTVCVAQYRAQELQKAYPQWATKIFHVPHSAPEWTVPDAPNHAPGPLPEILAQIPRPILGYIGGLEDRLDWELINRLARTFPDCSIVLVGPKPGRFPDEGWGKTAQETLTLPNVYAPGGVKQHQIASVYAGFDVNLIPYQVDHPFNLACSPTKLLDCMGSGRPTVTTSLPECLLYESLYRVVQTHQEFCDAVRALQKSGFSDGRELARWEYARSRRSALLLDALTRLTFCESADEARQILAPFEPGRS